jgi:carboxymethylenebutenolidase
MRDIEIRTKDGTAKAAFIPPASPGDNKAGVTLYMDAFGPRASLYQMAERLAGWGYAVLVPDLFYRFGAYGPFDAKTAFANEVTGTQIRKMLAETTQEMTMRDSGAFVDVLSENGVTDPVGAVGYCMGGARALNAAGAWPDRIVAAASFHGGGLGSDAPDSPASRAASIKAKVYVGSAEIDNSFPPAQSAKLAEALRTAWLDHFIEIHDGMEHGVSVPDHRVYDEKGAERHWKRLLGFFAETLGG